MRLNQRSAAALSLDPGKGEQRFFDDELTGFAVRVRAGGKKTWIIQCRVNGQARTYTIGDVGKIDADKARAEAKSKLAQAQLGIDPQAAKTDGRAGQTLGQISDLYLAQVRLEASRQERAETTASF